MTRIDVKDTEVVNGTNVSEFERETEAFLRGLDVDVDSGSVEARRAEAPDCHGVAIRGGEGIPSKRGLEVHGHALPALVARARIRSDFRDAGFGGGSHPFDRFVRVAREGAAVEV